MRRLLLGGLILLIGTVDCCAHSSIVAGNQESDVQYFYLANVSAGAASDAPLQMCRTNPRMKNCSSIVTFQDTCASVVASSNGGFETATGLTADLALRGATRACYRGGIANCTERISVCDGTAGSQVINPDGTTETALVEPAPPEQVTPNLEILKWFPVLQITYATTYFSILIIVGLSLWILISIVSTTPFPVLKTRVFIALWIGLPAVLAHAFTYLFSTYYLGLSFTQKNMIFAWSEVFVALAAGVALRRWLSPKWASPDLLSLPLTVLVFSVVAVVAVYEAVDLLTFQLPLYCNQIPPFSLSVCAYYYLEGFVIFGAALAILFLCGTAIPSNSNLILANDWTVPALKRARARVKAYFAERQARIKREIEEREARWKEEAEKEKERLEQEETGAYPVPAIFEGAPIDKMRLKLR